MARHSAGRRRLGRDFIKLRKQRLESVLRLVEIGFPA